MDAAKSNNRYCCWVPWAGDGGWSVHESLGLQLLPEKNVQGGKDVLVCPCVCFCCHCTDNARLMLHSDLLMAAALQKQLGKSEYLIFKNLFDLWWPKRQMQTRPFVAAGKPEINGSNERHNNKPGLFLLVAWWEWRSSFDNTLALVRRDFGSSSELGAHCWPVKPLGVFLHLLWPGILWASGFGAEIPSWARPYIQQLPAGWELWDPWAVEMNSAAPKGSSAPSAAPTADISQPKGKHFGIFHDGKIPIKNGLS